MSSAVPRDPGTDHEAGAGRVSATLVSIGRVAVPEWLVENLRREVIDVHLAKGLADDGKPPETIVVVAWLPVGTDEATLAALVRWASRGAPPVGLIGCCPDGARQDCEHGLAAEFDDFIVGRVSVRELAARIRALARRMRISATQVREGPRFGSIALDPTRHQLWIAGRRIPMTRTELAVMGALVAAQGRAISRAEILDAAWGDQSLEVGERAVDNVILRLRRKLGDRGAIVTVRGVGFRLGET